MPSSSSGSPKRAHRGLRDDFVAARGQAAVLVKSKCGSGSLQKPGHNGVHADVAFAKCTASHCVKFETAALAPLYAGIFVSGVNAFIEERYSQCSRLFPACRSQMPASSAACRESLG